MDKLRQWRIAQLFVGDPTIGLSRRAASVQQCHCEDIVFPRVADASDITEVQLTRACKGVT
jgi:hypothetical protein